MPDTKSLQSRKVVNDFLEFTDKVRNLENETEVYYWLEEAITRAAVKLNEIEER
jgi:hypothetical protein